MMQLVQTQCKTASSPYLILKNTIRLSIARWKREDGEGEMYCKNLNAQLAAGLPDPGTAGSPGGQENIQHHYTEHRGPSRICAGPTPLHPADP